MKKLRVAHFFAGVGGGMLASEILGHDSVLAVEIDPFRCQVLKERQADGWFSGCEIANSDIRDFNAGAWAGKVDCVSAGFPCQDISIAGRGAGLEGPKSGLFFSLLKAVDAIRPGMVFLENSPTIKNRGRDRVWWELERRGYRVEDGTLAAAHVGAGHKRNRWWCLAANTDVMWKLQQDWLLADEWRRDCNDVKNVADALLKRRGPRREGSETSRREEPQICAKDLAAIKAATEYTGGYNWFPVDAGICRMVDGIPPRIHGDKGARIKALGDAQVPLAAALAWILFCESFCRKLSLEVDINENRGLERVL